MPIAWISGVWFDHSSSFQGHCTGDRQNAESSSAQWAGGVFLSLSSLCLIYGHFKKTKWVAEAVTRVSVDSGVIQKARRLSDFSDSPRSIDAPSREIRKAPCGIHT